MKYQRKHSFRRTLFAFGESRTFSKYRGGLDGQSKGVAAFNFSLSENYELQKTTHDLPIVSLIPVSNIEFHKTLLQKLNAMRG